MSDRPELKILLGHIMHMLLTLTWLILCAGIYWWLLFESPGSPLQYNFVSDVWWLHGHNEGPCMVPCIMAYTVSCYVRTCVCAYVWKVALAHHSSRLAYPVAIDLHVQKYRFQSILITFECLEIFILGWHSYYYYLAVMFLQAMNPHPSEAFSTVGSVWRYIGHIYLWWCGGWCLAK